MDLTWGGGVPPYPPPSPPCCEEASRYASQKTRSQILNGSFFVGMPRLEHTADHTEHPPSFDP